MVSVALAGVSGSAGLSVPLLRQEEGGEKTPPPVASLASADPSHSINSNCERISLPQELNPPSTYARIPVHALPSLGSSRGDCNGQVEVFVHTFLPYTDTAKQNLIKSAPTLNTA